MAEGEELGTRTNRAVAAAAGAGFVSVAKRVLDGRLAAEQLCIKIRSRTQSRGDMLARSTPMRHYMPCMPMPSESHRNLRDRILIRMEPLHDGDLSQLPREKKLKSSVRI